jgi:hypothetical protein
VPAVDAPEGEADQDVGAEGQQDQGHHRGGDLGGEVGEERRAGEGADGTRNADLGDDLPVDVAELPVRETRRERRADLREVHRGRGGRGVRADGEQQGGRRDAIGHAQAAVDELRAQADEGEQYEGLHGR